MAVFRRAGSRPRRWADSSRLEDRGGLGEQELYQATQNLIGQGYQTKELAGLFSSFQVNVPQLNANIDRDKVKRQRISLTDLFQTMQVYLGSVYVNDFNKFGRTYQVIVQADAPFRATADNVAQLKVRNADGQMVPLGSVLTIDQAHGPDRGLRYNAYPAADINGGAAPGCSSGQAETAIERLAAYALPGIELEWTDLTYQQKLAGSTALFIFPLCVVLAFLVLAAVRAGPCRWRYPDRSDVPAERHRRRMADPRGQQHFTQIGSWC